MKRSFLFALGLWFIWLPSVQAQPAQSLPTERRFLFILDISFSMSPKARAVESAVRSLLLNGMSGQMQAGDTFGIWTFNDDLHTGEFPVQRWLPDLNTNIAIRTVSFLRTQRYEKKTELSAALTNMLELAENLENLTVILITDGDTPVRGTPFDSAINAIYKKNLKAMQKARTPFVTVFAAKEGKIVDYSVNTDSEPINIPPMDRKPLLSASRTNPAEPATVVETPEKAVPITVPPTNAPANVSKVISTNTVKITNTAATQPLTNPPPVPPKANETAAILAPPPVPQSPVPKVVPNTNNAVSIVTNPVPGSTAQISVTTSNVPTNSLILNTNPLKVVSPTLIQTNVAINSSATSPAPSVVATSNPSLLVVNNSTPAAAIVEPSKPKPVAAQSVIVVPPQPSSKTFLALAIILFGSAAVLGLLFLKRSRTPPQPSLISRSLDKK